MKKGKELSVNELMCLYQWRRLYPRRWKAELRKSWVNSYYPCVSKQCSFVLQNMRNKYGPSWLAKLNLNKIDL